MSRTPNTPSATCRSAAAEAAPAGGPATGNSQEGAAFSGTPWSADSCLMADRWSFRLLV